LDGERQRGQVYSLPVLSGVRQPPSKRGSDERTFRFIVNSIPFTVYDCETLRDERTLAAFLLTLGDNLVDQEANGAGNGCGQ